MTDINRAIEQLDWNREPRSLYEPVEYTFASGGKRLRPTLAMLASQMFEGNDEDVLPAALALEVFHNFTLLHDDVMDRAEVRRGRPTVHVLWNDNTAILSGDQMMIEAYRLLSGVPEEKLPKVLRMFNDMATGICEGQQYDMDFEARQDVSLEEYMNMIRLKTSVLLANALQTGAYIAGATEAQQQRIYDYGINLGLAFQIQDDLLDVYGDPATFGKATGGDILCGKKTFMLLTALHTATPAVREEIEAHLSATDTAQHKIASMTAIYDRLHVREKAEEAIAEYTGKALECLEALPHNDAAEALRNIANKLTTRKI